MRPAAELAARLGLPFRDLRHLEQALVHSSYPNEHTRGGLISNDRLEFLGDAVVALAISEALYADHPGDDEGTLTTRRAAIVSARGLARMAARLDLGAYLVLGQGADRAGERRRPSVLAAAFEAVAGAVHLELGAQRAGEWIRQVAGPELRAAASFGALKPPKSRLQELSYARTARPPEYRVLVAEGPDHAKHYLVEVSVGGVALAQGEGRNRREAETAAASVALEGLDRGS